MPIDLIRPQPMRLSRIRGFQLQVASRAINGLPALIVARPRRMGNPFKVTPPGDAIQREAAVWLYATALDPSVELVGRPDLVKWRRDVRAMIPTLRAHNLACWCPLPGENQPDCCHRAVLLRLANPAFDWGPPPRVPDGVEIPGGHPPGDGRAPPRKAPPEIAENGRFHHPRQGGGR